MKRIRKPLVLQLIFVFSMVALLSTLLALWVLDRSLSQDLEMAAYKKLQKVVSTSDRLLDLYLNEKTERYKQFIREPRMQAVVEAEDIPTLQFFADEALIEHDVLEIMFYNNRDQLVVKSGVSVLDDLIQLSRTGSFFEYVNDGVYVVSNLKIDIGHVVAGHIVVVELLQQDQLNRWSALLGVDFKIMSPGKALPRLSEAMARYPYFVISASNTQEDEALRQARVDLIYALLAALAFAVVISTLFARQMTQDIVGLQKHLKGLGEGDFTSRLLSERDDEIGDIQKSANEMAVKLQEWRSQLVELDYLNRINDELQQKNKDLKAREVTIQDAMNDLQQAHQQMGLYLQCLESAQEGVFIFNETGSIEYVNPYALLKHGYDKQLVLGKSLAYFMSPNHGQKVLENIWRVLQHLNQWKAELDFTTADHTDYPVELSVTRVQFEAEDRARFVAIFRDISLRSNFEAQLVNVANHDPLTGLYNRRAFEIEMTRVLSDHRNRNKNFAVIWLDLDRFKSINDNYGHQAGDDLLVELSGQLTETLRAVDVIARMGGDEIAFLLPSTDVKGARIIAEKLLERVRSYSLMVDGERLTVGGSFGVSIYPEDGHTESVLLKAADLAMYDAKRQGRDRVCFARAQQMNS